MRRPQLQGRRLTWLAACVHALALLACLPAHARMVEEVVDVAVTVKDMYGKEVSQAIKLTIFRDDARARSPFLVINHGRPASAADYGAMGRVRFADNAAYFVSRGFAVFVPTRVGYGVSQGADVEDSGGCSGKSYAAGFEAAAQQTVKVIELARSLPYVDAERGLLVGQSFGGAATIAASAKPLPGVIAAVNFAGGGGGNPVTRPTQPCRPDLLKRLFADYGATSRMPTLWLYSENDRFFGTEAPRQWFDGFVGRGGAGEFIVLPALTPPLGEDGHASFSRNPAGWHPVLEAFLARHGF